MFAAQNFSHYFKDFPDLEEDVIDSVYDICEDPDAQVIRESHSCGTASFHVSCFRCASKVIKPLYPCLPNPENGLDEIPMCSFNFYKAVCLTDSSPRPS